MQIGTLHSQIITLRTHWWPVENFSDTSFAFLAPPLNLEHNMSTLSGLPAQPFCSPHHPCTSCQSRHDHHVVH